MVLRVGLVCLGLLSLVLALVVSLGKDPEELVFADLPPLTGPVILTVSGAFERAPDQGEMAFDMAMLRALDDSAFSTSTIWTDGIHRFSGVSLHLLAAYLGVAEGAVLKFEAINDYLIEVPVSDAVSDGPIIAYAMDGAPMSIRERGPLWLIYPYDSDPDYQSEIIYTRSIWQLKHIEVSHSDG